MAERRRAMTAPDPAAVKALNDYVDRRLTEALAEATRCPNCGPWLLCDDPIGPGVWCPICGYSRPTARAEPTPSRPLGDDVDP